MAWQLFIGLATNSDSFLHHFMRSELRLFFHAIKLSSIMSVLGNGINKSL